MRPAARGRPRSPGHPGPPLPRTGSSAVRQRRGLPGGSWSTRLQSKSVTRTPKGTPVEVNGRPATITKVDPAAAQPYFTDDNNQIIVQPATELGPTDAELFEFASEAEAGID
jgi:hypothetical protein